VSKKQLTVLCSICLFLFPLLLKSEPVTTVDKIFKNFQLGIGLSSVSANTGNFESSTASQIFIESDINSYISLRLTARGAVDFEPETSSVIYLEYNEELIPAVNFKFTNNSPFTPYIGLQYVNWDLTPRGTANTLQKVSDDGPGLTAGIKVSFLQRFAAHVEYNRVEDVDDTDISFIQLGLSFQFR